MENRTVVTPRLRWLGQQLALLALLLTFAGGAWGASGELIHNSANMGTKYWSPNGWGVSGGKYGQFTCTTCHNKTTNNIKRVVPSISNHIGYSSASGMAKSVTFNNVTGFGNDAGGHVSSKRICEVCHTQTSVHRYDTTGQTDLNHKNANNTDCTTCHPHSLAFSASCGNCHGYPPDSTVVGAGGLASPATGAITYSGSKGAHVVHTNTATYNMKCETCHAGYTANPMGNSKIEMGFAINNTNYPGFAGTVPVATGTFTGNATLQNGYQWYSTSQHGTTINKVANTATCSVYCHGSTLTGGSAATPSWVGTNQATCTSTCHGMSAATPPTTGSHTVHASSTGTNLAIACSNCHGAHTDNTHVNGTVKWDLAGVSGSAQYRPNGGTYAASGNTGKLAPSASFGQCNNLYCHSSAQGPTGTSTGITYSQPTWGNSASVTCDSCHWGDTLSFKVMSTGSHRKHIVAYSYQCADCHNGAGHDTAKHADGTIDVTFAAGGTYNQPGTPGNGFNTCSNTVCHAGAATAPTWGGAPMPPDCTGCHGNEANAATKLSGAHDKHINNATAGGNFKCNACHAPTITNADNRTFANKALHANTLVNYSGVMAGRNKTCANFYCHSNGKGTFVNPPTWTSGTALGCDGCHGQNNGTGMPLAGVANNSHPKHAPTAADCWKCHQKTASKTAGQLVPGTTDHLDRTLDARLSKVNSFVTYSGSYNNAARTCSATYCHGGLVTTPAWGTANSTNCNSCHKSKPVIGGNLGLQGAHSFHIMSSSSNYNYTQAAANTSTTTAYNYTCSSCHGATTSAHADGSITATSDATIYFGYSSAGRNPAYGSGVRTGTSTTDSQGFKWTAGSAGTCNATYCHSNGRGGNGANAAITWASNTTTTCDSCHGNEANASTLSGAHSAHMNPSANLGGSFKCADCHAITITNTNNRTLANKTKHVNKFVDYSGVLAGRNKTCANFYCHSNGKGTFVNPPTWTSGTALGCDGCHGQNNGTGMPLAGVANNSHPKHAPTAGDCWKCHQKTASKTAGQLVPGTTDHLDRTLDARLSKVNSFVSYSGSYNNAARTCSATYCHGGAITTPAWGTANSTNCNTCHKSKPVIGGNLGLQGAHSFHIMSSSSNYNYTQAAANTSTTTAYNYTCSSCHGATTSAHADGSITATSDATIYFGYSSAGRNPAYGSGVRTGTSTTDSQGFKWTAGTAGTCNATYCHSNGRGGNGANATITWASNTTATCDSCHGNEANASTLSGAHNAHVASASTGGGFVCADCHATTITNTNNRTLANKTKHVNKFVDYSGLYAGKNKTCANFYCHTNGKGAFVNPPTWTSGTPLDCSGCHGSTALNLNTGNHAAHITAGATCQNCHWNTTQANGTIAAVAQHINKTVGVVQGSTFKSVNVSFTGTTSCSAISCHSNGTSGGASAVTWGSTLNCAGCHPNLSAAHTVHANLSLTTGVTFYNYTANKSTGSEAVNGVKYGFGCATCHPLVESTYHLDGAVEVQLDPTTAGASALRQKNGPGAIMNGDKSCDLVYCHSDGKNAMVAGPTGNGHAPVWTTTFATLGGDRCAKCHGNSPQTAAHNAHQVGLHYNDIYNGTSGKLAAAASGNSSHGVAGQSTTITCSTCHNKTMTSSANDQNALCNTCHTKGVNGATVKGNAQIADFSFHVNGKKEIAFPTTPLKVISKAQLRAASFPNYSGLWVRNSGNYKTGATAFDTAKVALTDSMWNSTAGTCSNISCHNLRAGQTVTWTDTTISCESCHSKL